MLLLVGNLPDLKQKGGWYIQTGEQDFAYKSLGRVEGGAGMRRTGERSRSVRASPPKGSCKVMWRNERQVLPSPRRELETPEFADIESELLGEATPRRDVVSSHPRLVDRVMPETAEESAEEEKPAIKVGLVTDIGGLMSHAAIVCREYGVPAVTGTGKATESIRTGDLIRVDGNTGKVTRL